MNKTAIKNFAIWARNKLRADIILKAGLLGITDKDIANPLPQSTDDLQLFDIGTSQPVRLEGKTAIDQRKTLVAAIRAKKLKHAEAFDAVIEEVAYTWFNRLIAVRFMEVNDYLPSRVRVLSSENPAKAEPDFVTNPFDTDLDFTEDEINLIDNLKDNNKSDELFQFLFIKQCNKLNEILPELFEKTNDYTELLLNVSFTDKDGVVYHLVHDISEDDFNIEKQGQVEIIGWLYQYYNTERFDSIYDGNMSKKRVSKEMLPSATQLFTPDWIVRYMVENSLGRIYCSKQFSSKLKAQSSKSFRETEKEIADEMGWKYYLPEAEQTPEVEQRLNEERLKLEALNFEQTTFLDPCMGSGHILVYAFDVFMDIYTAQGYTERDAAQRIVEKNLFGLELDDRATQLAYFAVMMKARSYDRRFFTRGIRPNLCSVQESNNLNTDYLELFGDLKPIAQKLVDEFIDAKEYGSILNLKITADEITQLESKYAEIDETICDNIFDTIRQIGLRTVFVPLISQAKIMLQKYDVAVTNPPYLGATRFSVKLANYINVSAPDEKSDLAMVILRKMATDFTKPNAYIAGITTASWMYLKSFEKFRTKSLSELCFVNIVDLGTELFDGKIGHLPIVSWIQQKHSVDRKLTVVRLVDYCYSRRDEKIPQFFNEDNRKSFLQSNFVKIPGTPLSYWLTDSMVSAFDGLKLSDYGQAQKGLDTCDVNRFVRYWQEVAISKIGFHAASNSDTFTNKWFPYAKGGEYRKWAGNNYYVVLWENDGAELRNFRDENGKLKSRPQNTEDYFKPLVTWSAISSSPSMRLINNSIYGGGGTAYVPNISVNYCLAFLNTKISLMYLKAFSPTINYEAGHVMNIPLIFSKDHQKTVDSIASECVCISQEDWDSNESSWNFKEHPFIRWSKGLWDCTNIAASMDYFYGGHPEVSSPLELCFMLWQGECNDRFKKLKANEEELNRIFIDIYGLKDELTPDVEDKDVTVRKADLQRDIRSFVSYAVGCMFGRYSLDREGLVFAGGDFDKTYWRFKGQAALDENGYAIEGGYAGMSMASYHYPRFKDSDYWGSATKLRFEPDADNCIPITDTAYFEDDIVGRFCEFVKVVYGEDTLEANLEFIAKALGNKGNTSRDIIRNYFLNDFFKDHCKIYQKRPIYWLFDSGKQNGFKALVYMHRWNADTIGNMRVEYLHRIQRTYEKEIEREQDTIDNTTNNRDKAVATKRKEKLQKQLKEAKDYDAKVAHLALFRPDIDLDDGVKVNYEKVQTAQDGKILQILAKI